MGKRDPRIDAYIEEAADFAKPILKHLRKVVHAACPDVVETMKWSSPHFDYKGMMCGMSAFKEHCAFGFWKADLVFDRKAMDHPMGPFRHLTSVKDLPSEKTLAGYVKKAMKLNDEGVKATHMAKRRKREALDAPTDLLGALAKNKKALATFEGFSPSHKREYIEWITEAKAADTRTKRLATAVEWMAEGKPRNWKYLR
jgi:uncharacterized protein YdeI (YjbR/CyaY-like superfamily)